MPTIRLFTPTDRDYAAVTQIEAAVWPDQYPTEDSFRYRDKVRPADRYFQRLMIEEEDAVVGFAAYMETAWSATPDEYLFYINVHPDWQRRGIGRATYQYIMDVLRREKQPAVLICDTRDDKAASIRFLEKRGYVREARYPRSLLDVQAFDHAPFARYPERMTAQGIVIKTLAQLMESDPDWARKLWTLYGVVVQDEPGPTPGKVKSLDEFIKENTQGPAFEADGYFVATDGDRFVGFSQLWRNLGHPAHLQQGWTGVDRPYRQKGIATAIKLRTIAWAQQVGATQIESDNFETNPMYDINMRLGFQPAPAILGYKKEVKDAEL